ncbi:MAG: DUF2892 domain-containing protein [Fidelibacterota bacterium]
MKCNVGKTDRRIRLITGSGILIVHYAYYLITGYYCVWANLAWILVLTALFRCCLLYMPFKFSTAKKEE